MSARNRTLVWLVIGAAFFVLLILFEAILLPFVVGLVIAYLIDPVCDWLEERGCSRTMATTIVTIVFFVTSGVVAALLIPVLYAQITDLIAQVPNIGAAVRDKAAPLLERMGIGEGEASTKLWDVAEKYAGDALKILGDFLLRVATGFETLFNLVALLIVTPVVTFYLLRDWDRLISVINGWLPRRQAPVIREQVREVDRMLSGFMRGQFIVCLLLGLFYAAGLTAAQLPFGAVIGLVTGFLCFIPFVGMLAGFAVGMGIAVAHFGSFTEVAIVAGVFIIGQVLEGNFLTPRIVGKKINLHPIWIIFALMAGGALFGFTGILIAVPVAAVLGVLIRFSLARYLASPLYGDGAKARNPGNSKTGDADGA